MSGYCGYSMSNNAVMAYESGYKPLSKWTKKEIIEIVEDLFFDSEDDYNFTMSEFRKMPVGLMKEKILRRESWHHTSKFYNVTNFYEVNQYVLEELTNEKISNWIAEYKEEQKQAKKQKSRDKKALCKFLEWSGTRNHPKAAELTEEGIIRGNWFYRSNGKKKSINANGFELIKEL